MNSRYLDEAEAVARIAEGEARALTNDEQRRYDEAMTKHKAIYGSVRYSDKPESKVEYNRAMTKEQRFADLPQRPLPDGIRPEELSMTRLVRGITTNDWRGAEAEQRAVLVEGTVGLGGYAVPAPLALGVIDKARAKSVMSQAGARFIPMDSKTLTMAKVLTDPTVYWRAEDATITESNPTLGPITLTAKAAAVIVRTSIELIEDAVDSGDFIEQCIAAAIASEVDRVGFEGSGSGSEPSGIKTYVTATTANGVEAHANGASLTYDMLSEAYYDVLAADFAPNALVMHPRDAYELDKLMGATADNYLVPPTSWAHYRKFNSSSLSTTQTQGTASSLCSTAYLGEFPQCAYGVRTQLVLEAFRAETTAVSKMEVVFRGYVRMDFQVLQPLAFCGVYGLKAS